MKNVILKSLLGLAVLTAATSVCAQMPLERILNEVEQNNASLAARRKLAEAQTLDARTGNSLENPDLEYIRLWGSPSELGKTGELTVTQPFDFPTAYAERNRLAKIRAEQFGHEYAAYRQQVLLEAKLLCINIAALKQKRQFLGRILADTEYLVEVYRKHVETGDANVLDENKARFELVAARNSHTMNELELEEAIGRLTNLNGGVPVETDGLECCGTEPRRPLAEITALYENASPELLALISEKNAAEQDIKVSRSQSLPRLALGYKHEFAAGERFDGIVMGMSIPMFGNRNNVKRARAQSAFAEAEVGRAVADMRSSLATLYARAGLIESAIDEYTEIMERTASEELMIKALEEGEITISEFYDLLRPVHDSHLTLIEARRDHALVCAQINMIYL